MAEIQGVALRLHKFIGKVQGKVTTGPVQPEYRGSMRPLVPKEPTLEIFEKCLGRLTDEECAMLDRILEKMSEGV